MVKEGESSSVFVFDDFVNTELTTVHAQRMVPYPATKHNTHMSEELRQQAIQYDASYHLVDKTLGSRKLNGGYELGIKIMDFEDDQDVTQEPLENIRDDLLEVFEKFLGTPGERNKKKAKIDLSFFFNVSYS